MLVADRTSRTRPPRTLRAGLSLLAVLGVVACSPTSPEPTVTPTPTSTPPPPTQPAEIVASLTDEQLVGAVLMPDVDLSWSPEEAAALVRQYQPGGVILMGNGTAEQARAIIAAMQEASPAAPLLISVDQEYGFVARIRSGMVQLPSAMAFGAAGQPDLTRAAWAAAGSELAAIGVNIDNAPVADVIGPAGNRVIGSRSYGSSADEVGRQVAAVVAGLRDAGVAATLKHFPGHGNTTTDSHTDLPVLSQSREQLEADLAPFRAGIAAGAQLVMTGHLDVTAIDPGVPATFSTKVLVDLLRGELGFTGVVVSDAMNMTPAQQWAPGEAAVRAILAGNDMLLLPPNVAQARDGLLEALRSGRLSRQRLAESATRIFTLRQQLAAAARPDVSTLDSAEHRAAARAVAAAGITVLSGPCTGALVTGPVRVTTPQGPRNEAAATALSAALVALGVTVDESAGTVIHLMGTGDGAGGLAAGAAVTVAMDTPYVLAGADSPVRLATYSDTAVAMQALADVLTGRATAPGRSPVTVPGLPASACP